MPRESKDESKKLVPEGAPASVSEHLPREHLNKDLQGLLDRQDSFFDELYDGQYEIMPATIPMCLHLPMQTRRYNPELCAICRLRK